MRASRRRQIGERNNAAVCWRRCSATRRSHSIVGSNARQQSCRAVSVAALHLWRVNADDRLCSGAAPICSHESSAVILRLTPRLLSAPLPSLVCLRAQRHGRVAPEQLDSTRPRWQPDCSGRKAGPHGRSACAGTRVGSHAHAQPYAGEWSSHSRQRCSRVSLNRSHSPCL